MSREKNFGFLIGWKYVDYDSMGTKLKIASLSGFVKKVKKLVFEAKGAHYFIHRYELATKTLPSALQKVLHSA